MSNVKITLDLTLYGCPMHYIKAREALRKMEREQEIQLVVNSGNAVEQVITSLRHDGQLCEITSTETLTTTIRVVKQHV
ncbi:sulfurtransferase TusA family protein [Pseudomonadota bacterium]|nr:sulfurtransferase TusA family protein [Pseudomonadota bacterium]